MTPSAVTVAVSVTAVPAVTSPEETLKVVVVVAILLPPALQGHIPAINIRMARTLNEAAGLKWRDAAWLGCINMCPLAKAESSEGCTILAT